MEYLETLRFDAPAIDYLASLSRFSAAFLRHLEQFRFSGDVHAVAEGTPVFADEPLLEITAPIAEAQLVESFVINQIQLQTMMASKAARVVDAADGREVVDFGMRRMHGTDAAVCAPRAFYIAGVGATSSVAAGQAFQLPLSGTMAHSYIQAHDDEAAAFRSFASLYPDAALLVDTYDTIAGVRRVVELARARGADFHVGAIRLDSGDLAVLSREARRILDEAGLDGVRIFASGDLDEERVAALVSSGAPIDGFGVGTDMGVSRDAPSLDMVYKLVEYAGRGRVKLSPGKQVLPGAKQVFRVDRDGVTDHDVIGRRGEAPRGRPLLVPWMTAGRRLESASDLERTRARTREQIEQLPARLRRLVPAAPPYRVEISEALASAGDAAAAAARLPSPR
jgi:nicotinate phosphoribosyltransferase